MKKLITAFMFLLSATAFAQNLQLHYDLGEDRKYFTTTVEMFRPDEFGSTFFFVDLDYNGGNPANHNTKNVSLAYWEIARYVNVYKGLSVTAQYNDGTASGWPLGPIVLAGVSYPVNLGFVTLNTDLLYRKDFTSDGANAQLTTTWFVPFLNGRVNFTGFMDIWTTKNPAKDKRDFVLLTEPQVWVNLINHVAIGTEIEISNNFIPGENKVKVNPTIAAKWTF
ncbi:MAG: DUF5020 family protein [Bacteroidota bacterium]